MIVVYSSTLVAILFGEPTAAALLARLAADPDRVMSVASYVETGTVLAGRRLSDRLRAADDLDRFLDVGPRLKRHFSSPIEMSPGAAARR